MKVLFFTQSDEICAASRTRVYQYLPFLKSQGVSYKVIPMVRGFIYKGALILPSNRIKKLLYMFSALLLNYLKSIYVLILAKKYDVIFIQRVMLSRIIATILKQLNNKIVFDFDDALFASENKDDNFINRLRIKRNSRSLPYMLSISKAVILENDYNKSFARQFVKDVWIITGPIDTDRYKPRGPLLAKAGNNIIIGWIGSATTTAYLFALRDVLKTLSKQYNITLKLIGATKIDIPDVKIAPIKWDLANEVVELETFDIGIMPLPDDEWTKGKGGYKLLQYLAMGIPAVTTPVGINTEIIQDGINGFLVRSDKEWIEKLSLLIENPDMRARFGRAGRHLVEEKYSVKANSPRLLEVLNASQR